MNLQMRLSDNYSFCSRFAIDRYSTAIDWMNLYSDFCLKGYDKIPVWHILKRGNYRPPTAWIHVLVHDNEWVNIGLGNCKEVYYIPNYDAEKLYDWAVAAVGHVRKLREFLEIGIPIVLKSRIDTSIKMGG